MTAGLPDMKKTGEIIKIQAEAGIGIVEHGIPFSDSVADDPVIQDAIKEYITTFKAELNK